MAPRPVGASVVSPASPPIPEQLWALLFPSFGKWRFFLLQSCSVLWEVGSACGKVTRASP